MQLSADIARKLMEALSSPRSGLVDPKLMRLLFQHDAAQQRLVVRWGMWAAVLSYMAYGVFDWILFPDIAGQLVFARCAIGISFLAVIEFGIRRGASLAAMHLVAAAAIVTGAVGWLLLALVTAHQQALSHFIVFGIVFVLGANLFFNFRFILSAISSTIIAAVFVAATLLVLEIDFTARLVIAALFINCLVFSLYLSWRLGVERYWTFLEALQAKSQAHAATKKGDELHRIANTDPLTGLRNRRAITSAFSELYEACAGEEDEIGVVLIDVDHFKKFNDRLGHQAGDDCLIRVAQTLEETAEANGSIVGRYGGEEFLVLSKVSEPDELRNLAEEFCRVVENLEIHHPDRGDGVEIVTISAGASQTSPSGGSELQDVLQEADRALYISKFTGRSRVTIYDPQIIDADHSSESLAGLLAHAIERQCISVVYQPIIQLGTEEIIGYETLMRLKGSNGRLVKPDIFIPVAEQNGAIVELGAWVFEQACADVARYKLDGVIAVNISAVQLKTPGFALRVAEMLARHGLAPGQFALELSERGDILGQSQAAQTVEQLRSLGVQIWLDDFGTGYAGIDCLRRFELDIVKIDRSFLPEGQHLRDVRMLTGMIQLLRSLGRTVLVEGVETLEQKRLLEELGVDFAQGYLIGRPQPVSEIIGDQKSEVA
ncbi:putative bifunctional diguanylate cyclase/phosphodiesterase [Nitratireductor sp. L15S-10]|uniref:putative bifunctional diguanylate cyclase/phosphodiesterase n=1 Tax=Nitratireductor sp. L15S-10 TaxID=3034028 RepID=UPI003857DABD